MNKKPFLKWKKAALSATDRVLATNGAHSIPERWDLVDDAGARYAIIRKQGGQFVLTYTDVAAETRLGHKFTSASTAKDAGMKRCKDRLALQGANP